MSDAAVSEAPARPAPAEVREFDYRPVPVSVVVGLALSVLGLTALLGFFGIPLALFGALLSLAAWWKVRSSEGAYGGRGLAVIGAVLGALGAAGGTATQVYAYKTEVPEGFERISFEYDISRPGIRQSAEGVAIPQPVADLSGQDVFLKGYMYPDPQNRREGIDSFLLVKDLGDCCFGGTPALTDMIGVEFPADDDLRATFYEQTKVSVAGTFRVREDFGAGENEPVYGIDAKHFDRSRSAF